MAMLQERIASEAHAKAALAEVSSGSPPRLLAPTPRFLNCDDWSFLHEVTRGASYAAKGLVLMRRERDVARRAGGGR